MSIAFLPSVEKDFYIYAMLCMDIDGPLYVKFGRTSSLSRRLTALRTGSPIPAVRFAVVEVKSETVQVDTERALLDRFKDRQTTGEWFRFDVTSEIDKRDFNDGCVQVFVYNVGPGVRWRYIDVAELDAADKKRRASFVNSRNRGKIIGKRRDSDARKKAGTELDRYGR